MSDNAPKRCNILATIFYNFLNPNLMVFLLPVSKTRRLSSHVAPLGMLFYTGGMLPQKYQGGVFISEHGSWDRSPLNGYNVSFIAFKEGKPVGKPESIISCFVSEDEKELYGAPVGLAQDNQGALIIADDVGNTVWRVTAK